MKHANLLATAAMTLALSAGVAACGGSEPADPPAASAETPTTGENAAGAVEAAAAELDDAAEEVADAGELAAPDASDAADDLADAADAAANAVDDAAAEAGDAVEEAAGAAEDVVEAAANEAGAGEGLPDGLVGDAAAGRRVFTQCMSCHAVEEGRNMAGPSLYGIVGRPAGTIEGFRYSPANRDSGIVWTERTMFEYLENPQRYIRGTIMAFPGLRNPQDRADVIAYLKSVVE
ncbi:MAG: cytochrome c family protein [Pseudomonadota bacterium]